MLKNKQTEDMLNSEGFIRRWEWIFNFFPLGIVFVQSSSMSCTYKVLPSMHISQNILSLLVRKNTCYNKAGDRDDF